MRRLRTDPTNNFDKKFHNMKIAKRNKKFFDLQMIQTIEDQGVRQRRVPNQNSIQQFQGKMNQSFMNTTQAFSCKVENEIEKFKLRISLSTAFPRTQTQGIETQIEQSIQSPDKPIKQAKTVGFQLQKMISREYIEKINDRQITVNEERYNNFYLTSPNNRKIRSFQKYTNHFVENHLQNSNQGQSIDADKATKAKQDIKFTRTTVAWNYKKQKYDRGPITFNKSKDCSFSLTAIPQQNIAKARSKIKADWSNNFVNIRLSLKDNPSQFERIYHSPNCDYRQKNKFLSKKPNKNLKIKERISFVQFEREQLCDLQYFRRRSHKNNRAQNLLSKI